MSRVGAECFLVLRRRSRGARRWEGGGRPEGGTHWSARGGHALVGQRGGTHWSARGRTRIGRPEGGTQRWISRGRLPTMTSGSRRATRDPHWRRGPPGTTRDARRRPAAAAVSTLQQIPPVLWRPAGTPRSAPRRRVVWPAPAQPAVGVALVVCRRLDGRPPRRRGCGAPHWRAGGCVAAPPPAPAARVTRAPVARLPRAWRGGGDARPWPAGRTRPWWRPSRRRAASGRPEREKK